ncbi:2-succinyl-5-enolpyruvyl-6-hydroxy-3-cyclohexene-1-carboxylic-acid synthase [Zafaria sp. J156]|uniref:2-succinyl-5-enolpyruvyl-6-hydroxy-3- cyclohexene-1-carboxylic-acid synthase n=1 Tax=Zafaria sp. J156 TaxID=3116490 RepID=UPI002E79F27F|nr:2-succinyl-5-enolpyruvyl-6-hydroxy-3-cyclohexene-1-carboxylic-acid synthase [Zafaria sp. J156]MEE1621258.1 2-succinyl-5-enolpyruvyl-6-hydroxy-3-cyclohexene-1-carboxylic-acid synthase [Zafaria sp. J156]
MSTAAENPVPAGHTGPTSIETARRVLAGLHDAGLRHLVLSPGSRSAPLAYAAAEAEAAGRLVLHVRIDERDAAFTALGLALATGRPAAVGTTSGTAAGELLPAVMEAHHAGVPLVVLTADRPEELRGTGANQTTIQPGLFAAFVRAEASLEAGEAPESAVRRVLLAADGIAEQAAGDGAFQPAGVALHTTARGPVHLNLAFRDPLVPGPGDRLAPGSGAARSQDDAGAAPAVVAPPPVGAGPGGGEPASDHGQAPRPGAAVSAEGDPASDPAGGNPDGGGAPALAERRTVVVAGHGAGPEAEAFARRHGLPLLAEPSSNARFGPNAIGPYRLLLPVLAGAIERVVVFGRPTLSRPVARLLAGSAQQSALYLPEPAAWFEPGRRPERLIEDPADLALFAGRGAEGWLGLWQEAAAAALREMDAVLEDAPLSGPELARGVWETARGTLVLGSSNPVRDADLLGTPAAAPGARVHANRGLAGIDGMLATATGIALATGGPATVLLGDVTFVHDAGGLLIGRGEPEPELDIVVLNDAGGAIFSLLEHGGVGASGRYGDAVERLFATPHDVRIEGLAAAYGLGYERIQTRAELGRALRGRGGAGPRRRILDVRIDRAGLPALHERLAEAARAAAEAALAARSAEVAG